MGIIHSGITQSSLVLRSEIGQRLSILQFDGNFVYLEDLALGVSQSLASLPLVPAGGTAGQVLAKVSGTDYDLEWVDQTGGTSGGGSGTNGTSGTSGLDGSSGTSGLDGSSGTSGLDGSSGTSGLDGSSGTSGVDGASAPIINILGIYGSYSGLTQSVGNKDTAPTPNYLDAYIVTDTSHVWIFSTASGEANSEGWVDMGTIAGAQGVAGSSGTSGVDGVAGEIGATGPAGQMGATGSTGENGSSGTSGAAGAVGATGSNGTSGTSGISSSVDLVNNIFELSSYNFNLLDPNLLLSGDYYIDVNNNSYEIPMPWDINFLGATYASVWINSNSYVTFGASSSASQSIAPGVVSVPAIFVGAGDNSIQGYFFGFDDDPTNEVFRIRYEGSNDESGDFNFSASILWELIFNLNTPDSIQLVVGTNLRNPGGVYGISDGTNWIERYTALPTYDEKTNTNLNSVDIVSVMSGAGYSDTIREIKFVGPGVYKVLEGQKATINIDPLNQYGVSVNYDTAGASVIAANKYDLRLTTGKDGSTVRLRPRGDVYLQPYSRNVNQFGAGYNVRLIGSNASQDSDLIGDYDGGSIYITPGLGVGTGVKGNMYLGTASSKNYLYGITDVQTLRVNGATGWSGTYSTGDSTIVTVDSGIITGIA